MDKVQYYETQLDEQLANVEILKSLESSTGVPKTYIFLGGGVIIVGALIFDIYASFFTNLVGWLFPAYLSFQSLDNKKSDDYVQWISYWVVFGLFNVLEFFSGFLTYLIPFYYLLKTVFLLWLLLPNYRGAEYAYKAALRPVYLKISGGSPDAAESTPSKKDESSKSSKPSKESSKDSEKEKSSEKKEKSSSSDSKKD